MNYNAIINITETADNITEPITVQEVKDYLRLEGFTDTDESTSESLSDFDFDDTLIGEAITAVREMFEVKCSLSLVPKTLDVVLTNLKGMVQLPRGPVTLVTGIVNSEGDAIDTDLITVVGSKYLKSPTYENMTVTYDVGYTEVPKAIKLDLLRAAAYYYMNRGMESVPVFVSQLASKYSRNTWLA